MFWFINNKEKNVIDNIIQEILIPYGISNEFQLSYPFQRTDMLRGISKIQFITVCMKLIVTIKKFKTPYKKFFVWLSEDLNLLLSPIFYSDREVDELYLRLLEIMVLYQGLLPETESKFINHQIVCIIYHIKVGGSVRNLWTIPGERALSSIKKFIPEGGRSFDLQTILNYSLWENESTLSFFKSISTSSYTYSDQVCTFTEKPYGYFSFQNDYEISNLLYVLINEIKKRNSSESSAKKFRLYMCFIYYVDYLKTLKKKYVGQKYLTLNFFEYLKKILIEVKDFTEYINKLIYYFNFQMNTPMYNSAIVYGIKMDSFGGKNEDINNNDLLNNWYHTKIYSSWFKLRNCNYNEGSLMDTKTNSFFNNNDSKEKYSYGQFKYFFEIKNFPPEPELKDLKFASVLIRYDSKNSDRYSIDKVPINGFIDMFYLCHFTMFILLE